ncbi:MAG TPA: prenyltransferase/squalene oxidase repeat-containing protein [Phycisphaerae bacterium]|nr:prenyltransferase/squalene oxidase repeat-containing protein [Phycisphaerae bacterium]
MTRRRANVLWLLLPLLAIGPEASVVPARADEAEEALSKYFGPLDKALDKALAYLAKQQAPNGSFQGGQSPVAVASLATMAFLAKGYTPGTGPYGQHINRGIDFVMDCQKPNGLINGPGDRGMYSHGMAALMLSEVSGMVDAKRQAKIDQALPKAVALILTAQQVAKPPVHQGGWRYNANSTDSDISLTGWQLMAIRSARSNGAQVPKKAIDDAVGFVLRCRERRAPAKDPKTGRSRGVGFGYQPGGAPGLERTAVAVLCLELCGHHRSPEAVAGGDWLLANLSSRFGAGYFYYGLYYSSQAMFQLGGEYWQQFAPYLYEMMLKFQRDDGSWPQGSSGEAAAGPCYSTAMGVLSLAVSYRQLPIYQR